MANKNYLIEFLLYGRMSEDTQSFLKSSGRSLSRFTFSESLDGIEDGPVDENLKHASLIQADLVNALTKGSLSIIDENEIQKDYVSYSVRSDVKTFPYNISKQNTDKANLADLIFLLSYLGNYTPIRTYFLSQNPDYKSLYDKNSSEFNDTFGDPNSGQLWTLLNNSPYSLFDRLDDNEKRKISDGLIAAQIIVKYALKKSELPTIQEVYDFFTSGNTIKFSSFPAYLANTFSGEVIYPYLIKDEGNQLTSNFVDLAADKNGNAAGDRGVRYNMDNYGNDKYTRNFLNNKITKSLEDIILNINKKLFLSESQIDISIGNRQIVEGDSTKTISLNDVKEISKLAEKDVLFNIFRNSFIDQNENSTIYKYISNIISSDDEEPQGLSARKNVSAGLGSFALGATALLDFLSSEESEEFNDRISQCILLTGLKNFALYSVNKRQNEKHPYGGRVHVVDTAEPNLLINYLSSPRGINSYIKTTNPNDTGTFANVTFEAELYKIVEENGVEKEYKFLFENMKDASKKSPRLKSVMFNDVSNPIDLTSIQRKKIFNRSKSGNEVSEIKIKDLSIDISGETVATVRSNIDVVMNFSMPSLDAILAIFQADSKYKDSNGRNIIYDFSFSELLSHNVGRNGKFDGTNASRALKTAYTPKKNRLVLKIIPVLPENKRKSYLGKLYETDEGNALLKYIENSGMILDLLLVNYDATRTNVNESDSIQITFKGYIKSFLNEPFCDVLTTPELRQKLFDLEQEAIKDLEENDKYCDIKEVRKRIQTYYTESNTKREDEKNKPNGKNSILSSLIKREKIYSIPIQGDIIKGLQDNVDRNSKKIRDPGKIASLINSGLSLQNSITTINEQELQAAEAKLKNTKRIQFFYFGDLIDVLLDVMYGEPKKGVARKIDKFRDDQGEVQPAPEDGTTVTEIRKKFANFPLKVILPTFYPVILQKDGNKDIFVTSQNESDKISVADIPISVSYFQHWYAEEISKRKTKIYPLGSMINRLLGSLVNNVISDSCYTIGNIEKKYFSVKSDFGAPVNKDRKFVEGDYNKNVDSFNIYRHVNSGGQLEKNTRNLISDPTGSLPYVSAVKLTASASPYLKKLINIERNKHINYLIIYEQYNSFADFSNVSAVRDKTTKQREGLITKDIPEFKQKSIDPKTNKGKNNFVQKLTFSKTELPYGEEVRFYNDGLNELSTISAVHDCTINCGPLLTMYPGMVCWIDPGFIDGPEIYGSIPWTMGIGGFHISHKVSHKGNLKDSFKFEFKTTVETKFVNSGAGEATVSYRNKCKQRVKDLKQSNPQPTGRMK